MRIQQLVLMTLTTVMISTVAHAGSWECETGNDGAECFVTNVRYYTGAGTYVRAELSDPNNNTSCQYVRVKMDNGAVSDEAVSAARNILLTALASGLPVKFYRMSDYGDSSDCYADYVMIVRK